MKKLLLGLSLMLSLLTISCSNDDGGPCTDCPTIVEAVFVSTSDFGDVYTLTLQPCSGEQYTTNAQFPTTPPVVGNPYCSE